jgi:hypothetical protein
MSSQNEENSNSKVNSQLILLQAAKQQAELQKKAAKELSSNELKEVADAAVATTEESEAYLAAHPELQEIVANFAKACLETKPENVYDFAIKYFNKVA